MEHNLPEENKQMKICNRVPQARKLNTCTTKGKNDRVTKIALGTLQHIKILMGISLVNASNFTSKVLLH